MPAYDDGFEAKPGRNDAPDACQYRGCSGLPTHVVRFREPAEYLCYCSDHSQTVYDSPYAKYRSQLR